MFTVTVFILVLTILTKVYFKLSNKFCKSAKRLDGRTCIVTGGTAGMGLEIAKDFARRGARVIIACPFEEEGIKGREAIVKESGNDQVIYKHLDLGSLKSTRKFAEDILKTENRLDLLINNAGVGPEKKSTKDGLNFTMQINYYGHVLLTILLLPLLKETGRPTEKSRIVNTTSLYHYIGAFEPDKMNERKYWKLCMFYANSKLCLLLFSTEMKQKLKGHNIVMNSVDPGAVGTAIFERSLGYFGFIVGLTLRLLVKTPWEGAQTALHAAIAEELGDISGEYLRNCELCKAKSIAYDHNVAKELWEESVRLVHLSDLELNI